MFALMNADNSVASITDRYINIEWGGAMIGNVRLLTIQQRQARRIWEVVESGGDKQPGQVPSFQTLSVDVDSKTVTRVQNWRDKTQDEIDAEALRERAVAIAAFIAEDDMTADRAMEVATRLAAKPNVDVRGALYRCLADRWQMAAIAYQDQGQTAKAQTAKAEYSAQRSRISEAFP